MSRNWRRASRISAFSGCARSRGIWKTKSVRHPRRCKSASIVSAESLGSGRLPGAPSTGSLWNLQVVQNVRRDTAQATCVQEERATGEASHVPPSKSLRGRVRHVELPFGSKVTTRAGVLLREKDTSKLRAAPRRHRSTKARP